MTGRRSSSGMLARLLFGDCAPASRVATKAVLAFALAGFLLSMATAADLPALYGPDEKMHLAYVGEVLDGRLPTVDTPVPTDGKGFQVVRDWYGGFPPSSAGPRGDIWVANHPPLTYLVAAPFVASAQVVGEKGPAGAMRLLSAAAFAVGVVGVAAVATGLVPGRRRVAVVAAGLAALTPAVVGTGALGHNDGLGFALATALLAVALRVVRMGPSRARLLGLVGLCAAAALTRAGLLPLVPLSAAVWAVCRGREDRRAAVGEAAVILGVAALVAGPFYARNIDLYGSITGRGYLLDKFDRTTDGSTVEVLVNPRVWLGVWQAMWAESGNGASVGPAGTLDGPFRTLGAGLWVGGSLAFVSAAGWVRMLIGRRRWPSGRSWFAWGVGGAFTVATMVGFASHTAVGGHPFPRFLLPAHAVVVTALAVGLVSLLPRAWAAVAALAGLVWVDLVLVARAGPNRELIFARMDLPGWMGVVEVVAAVGAVGAAGAGLWLLTRTWTTVQTYVQPGERRSAPQTRPG